MEPEFRERRPQMVIDEDGIIPYCGWGIPDGSCSASTSGAWKRHLNRSRIGFATSGDRSSSLR